MKIYDKKNIQKQTLTNQGKAHNFKRTIEKPMKFIEQLMKIKEHVIQALEIKPNLRISKKINDLEEEIAKLDDQSFPKKTKQLKERGSKSLKVNYFMTRTTLSMRKNAFINL